MNPSQLTATEWYNNKTIQIQLVKQLKNRYLHARVNIPPEKRKPDGKAETFARKMYGYNLHTIQSSFDTYNIPIRDGKVYRNTCTFSTLPMWSYNPIVRAAQKKELNDILNNARNGYDLFIDIDGAAYPWEIVKKDTHTIACYLRDLGFPIRIKFSGAKGFHIITDAYYMPEDIPVSKLCDGAFRIAQHLQQDIINPEHKIVDFAIYEEDRIQTLAYSYDNRTKLFAKPLFIEEILPFEKKDATPTLAEARKAYEVGLKEIPGDHHNVRREIEKWINVSEKEIEAAETKELLTTGGDEIHG